MEMTLRRYERPSADNDRELLRKFCLSIGLLQPGDSRDVIVDIMLILLNAKTNRTELSSEQIREKVIDYRRKNSHPMTGIASSNIRRQIKRLRDMMLIEKNKNSYKIAEFAPLSVTFEEKIERFMLPQLIARIKEYFREIDSKFN
jgi:hypothetical protein